MNYEDANKAHILNYKYYYNPKTYRNYLQYNMNYEDANKAHIQGGPLLLGLGPKWLGISFGTKAHLVGKIASLFAWYRHSNITTI